jgi:hypothetical protein
MSPPCRGGGLRASITLRAMPSGSYVPGRAPQEGEAVREKPEKLVLQVWGFCGWPGNPLKENEVLISKDALPWISADQMIKDLATRRCRNRSKDLIHGGR